MSLYVGATQQITISAIDFAGSIVITPSILLGGTVTIEIEDSDGDLVLAPTSMTWDATRNLWFYLWTTTGMAAGAYEAKVILTGVDGSENFQFRRIHIKAPPF